MSDLIDQAAAILKSSERGLAVHASNVTNLSTVGYRKQVPFSAYVERDGVNTDHLLLGAKRSDKVFTDWGAGSLKHTKRPLDLAISGEGAFLLRSEDGLHLTRAGSFQISERQQLVTSAGLVVQTATGADLVLPNGEVEIMSNGLVLVDDLPYAKIGIYEVNVQNSLALESGTTFTLPSDYSKELVKDSFIRQGYLESANVANADEMLGIMRATKRAEIGGNIAQVYDQLMGQVISTFGRSL